MKATINAPHSILHRSECEILELYNSDKIHIVKIEGHPNPLPFHPQEINIDWSGYKENKFPQIDNFIKTVDAIVCGLSKEKECRYCYTTKPVSQFSKGWTDLCDSCAPF